MLSPYKAPNYYGGRKQLLFNKPISLIDLSELILLTGVMI